MKRRKPKTNVPAPGGRTAQQVLDYLEPGISLDELAKWPPDVFALTSCLLEDTGAYRFVVDPPDGKAWPPRQSWHDDLILAADEWRNWVEGARLENQVRAMPAMLKGLLADLDRALSRLIAQLRRGTDWKSLQALLTLHALADTACDGFGLLDQRSSPGAFLRYISKDMVDLRGTLSHFSRSRVRVLPKIKVPRPGITIRSLSHNLATVRGETDVRWLRALAAESPPEPSVPSARAAAGSSTPRRSSLHLLLVPWPYVVHPSDFQPTHLPLENMDNSRFGSFAFDPKRRLPIPGIRALIQEAKRRVNRVDGLVLPEAAISPAEAKRLKDLARKEGVRIIIAGIREPNANYLEMLAFAGGAWRTLRQDKHHRWLLDRQQVPQYHLGSSLDPDRDWWEAIAIPPRRVCFAELEPWLTVCPLICEDLARIDPVSGVIRAVGPNLVIALLQDGPQLAGRWTARYASILTDDPGSAVMSLTSLGMAVRSTPAGASVRRVVALWKDRASPLREIELAPGSDGVVLALSSKPSNESTADGRREGATKGGRRSTDLILAGITQIPGEISKSS